MSRQPDHIIREESQAGPGPGGPVVFILGLMPRSGTNFLHRLVCLHPHCGAVNMTPVREDYLIKHSHLLLDYVRKLGWQWGHWGDSEPLIKGLLHHAGAGLTSFLHSLNRAEWIVTKTPSSENLGLALDLFPDSRIVVIVRDGRSVVASGMEGFGWTFDAAARRWSRAAREVADLMNQASPSSFLVVSYESLHEDTWSELCRVYDFVGLDPDLVDVNDVRSLPVFGSSFVGAEQDGLSWKPVERPEAFSGSVRWADWSRKRHERFNWLAGPELEALGYAPKRFTGLRLLWHAFNVGMDVIQATRRFSRTLFRSSKAAVRSFIDGFGAYGS